MPIVDLNCDMGEGMDNDAELMQWISSANIACGAHAGDEYVMHDTIELAIKNGVAIGAHPGFADKAHFGRLELDLTPNEIYGLVYKQVTLLQQMCTHLHATLHHVKPHGALYNMAARNAQIAQPIVQAVTDVDARLILYGLSGSQLIIQAQAAGLRTASEVFADRTYQPDGTLTPRLKAGAMIEDVELSVQQVLQMVLQKTVTTTAKQTIAIHADTICLHGDGEHALEFAAAIFKQLQQHNIHVKAIA